MTDKAQLHQLLPVESNLQGIVKKVIDEAIKTFGKKEHFLGFVKKLHMFDEARKEEETVEVKEVSTTVQEKLDYVLEAIIRYYDAYVQKERTNQDAKADLVVDGKTLASGVPATALLGLETKLKELRTLYSEIPTLLPGIKWVETDRSGIYENANEEARMKTEKSIQFKEVSKATDKFPAQVEKWTTDIPVGKYIQRDQSGLISTAKKSELLGRIDKLIQAVMEARMRANSTPIVDVHIGKAIIDYING